MTQRKQTIRALSLALSRCTEQLEGTSIISHLFQTHCIIVCLNDGDFGPGGRPKQQYELDFVSHLR